MICKLGKCIDAFDIKESGLILAYELYSSDNITHYSKVKAKIIKEGVEVQEVNCVLGYVLSGKRARYDMSRYSITITEKIDKKNIIGSEVYLLCEYNFWQPDKDINHLEIPNEGAARDATHP
jgi:hypothetical protein